VPSGNVYSPTDACDVWMWNGNISSHVSNYHLYIGHDISRYAQLLRRQHIIKILYVVLMHLLLYHIGRSRLMWMSENGLHKFKLVQHVLQKITDHVRSISESSWVKTDFLELTCVAVLMIRGEDKVTKINVIWYCRICDNHSLRWNKHHDTLVSSILHVFTPEIPITYSLKVLKYPSLHQHQHTCIHRQHVNKKHV
jgi:hypothetical protein